MVIGTQKGSAQLTALEKTGLFHDVKLFDSFSDVWRVPESACGAELLLADGVAS
jgi:hypothetical protein